MCGDQIPKRVWQNDNNGRRYDGLLILCPTVKSLSSDLCGKGAALLGSSLLQEGQVSRVHIGGACA